MKRLIRKAEIYDGFKYDTEYCEVYKNPTPKEIEDLKKQCNGIIRGVISKNNNLYIWPGFVIHLEINSHISSDVPLDYFRFAYDNNGEWYCHLKHINITFEECQNVVKNNLNGLSQIGDANLPFELYLSTGIYDFQSINDFLNTDSSELDKKTAKLIKAVNVQLHIGDQVQWKRHPYDNSVYEVKEILPNGNVFIDNGITAFTDIKPSVLKFVERSAE